MGWLLNVKANDLAPGEKCNVVELGVQVRISTGGD